MLYRLIYRENGKEIKPTYILANFPVEQGTIFE